MRCTTFGEADADLPKAHCYTGPMNFRGFAYVSGDTAVHRCDARTKIVALLVYSVAIFFIRSWWGMALFTIAVGVAASVARIPVRRMVVPLVPVLVFAGFAVLFAVVADLSTTGLSSGLFVAVRMVALVAASFVVCFTTTASELLGAFSFLIRPLRSFHVPVEDVSFTLALALRFIPVIADELWAVRVAQVARGGTIRGLAPTRRLQIWGAAFSAVFVGLFRHADALATAMDARCYALASHETIAK